MREGDVVLAVLPQADRQNKKRPVVVLRKLPAHQDFLVCGISTRLHQGIADFDEAISPLDPDFRFSGLRASSLIRLSFLAVLPSRDILGSIGAIARERHRRLLQALADYLVSNSRN